MCRVNSKVPSEFSQCKWNKYIFIHAKLAMLSFKGLNISQMAALNAKGDAENCIKYSLVNFKRFEEKHVSQANCEQILLLVS